MNKRVDGISAEVLACEDLQKNFREGPSRVDVLRGVDFAVRTAELVAIIGASGSGKTTLLQLLGGLDIPSAGVVRVAVRDMSALDDGERGRLRNSELGFVYQFHHLLPEFSALENVAMPLLIRRDSVASATERAARLLEKVGLGGRLDHKPAQLSGGERQRAAVARALITRPAVVLADEPTGNLDGPTGARVFDLMLELNREEKTALVVVTHDLAIASRMERVLRLENGALRAADL
ncbi:MAG: lipoprotein-releasing system ATP-binding protein LolD [Chromatiales bacterium]|nr:MAG: lipoprotein-releasing system ATP-binding protein LolD [Chromatiales bacterium]